MGSAKMDFAWDWLINQNKQDNKLISQQLTPTVLDTIQNISKSLELVLIASSVE